MSNDSSILEMSDLVISYCPKPACWSAKTLSTCIEPILAVRKRRAETEHRRICKHLVQWLKTRGSRRRFAQFANMPAGSGTILYSPRCMHVLGDVFVGIEGVKPCLPVTTRR